MISNFFLFLFAGKWKFQTKMVVKSSRVNGALDASKFHTKLKLLHCNPELLGKVSQCRKSTLKGKVQYG